MSVKHLICATAVFLSALFLGGRAHSQDKRKSIPICTIKASIDISKFRDKHRREKAALKRRYLNAFSKVRAPLLQVMDSRVRYGRAAAGSRTRQSISRSILRRLTANVGLCICITPEWESPNHDVQRSFAAGRAARRARPVPNVA